MNYLVIANGLPEDAVWSAVATWPGARAEVATLIRANDEALSAARTIAAARLRRVAVVWSPPLEATDEEDIDARAALEEVGSTDAALFSLSGAVGPGPIPEVSPFVEWMRNVSINDELAQYGPHAVRALAAAAEFVQQPIGPSLLSAAMRWIDLHPGYVLATLNPQLGAARATILAALTAAPVQQQEQAYIIVPKSLAVELAVRAAAVDLVGSRVSVLMVGLRGEISLWPEEN